MIGGAVGAVCVELARGEPERSVALLHPAGGQLFCYRALAAELAPRHTVLGIQSRGVVGDEAPAETMEELAEDALAALGALAGGPALAALAGWSLGGVLAWECGVRLADRGLRPPPVILLDSVAPAGEASAPGSGELDMLGGFATELGLDLESCRRLAGALAGTPPARWIRRASEEGLLPPGLEPPLVERLFTVYRAHRLARDRYRPRPYDGDVLLVAADAEPYPPGIGPDLGWSGHARGRFRRAALPATHRGLLERPPVRELGRVLNDVLARWSAPGAPGAPG